MANVPPCAPPWPGALAGVGPSSPPAIPGGSWRNGGTGANPNLGHPAHVNVKKPSDQRFRSFAERYMIARAHHFRVDMSDHTEDQWACIMDAKRAYAMIQRVGQNIEPEEGVF